jgi:hypothetical protein
MARSGHSGRTVDEARTMLLDATREMIASYKEQGREPPIDGGHAEQVTIDLAAGWGDSSANVISSTTDAGRCVKAPSTRSGTTPASTFAHRYRATERYRSALLARSVASYLFRRRLAPADPSSSHGRAPECAGMMLL